MWVCTIACYDKAVKDQADVMEGQYVPLTFLPFEEASTNKTLAAFMKYVGKDNANGFAVYGWTATLAFKQAVDAIVKKDGVNGLTRANLLSTGVDGLTSFDAGGMIGTVDIKNKVPTTCSMIDPAAEGQVRAAGPDEEGHVRLQEVEQGADPGGPDRKLTPITVAAEACPTGTWPGAC